MVNEGLNRFVFQREKAVEMVLYLAQRIDDPTVMKICKLMYFADKHHLDQWGQFLCGDDYVAMEHGPVPTDVYDMLKKAQVKGSEDFEIYLKKEPYQKKPQPHIKPLREENMDMISEAARQSLDWVLCEYGAMRIGRLYEIAHEEEAWQKAWDDESTKKRFDMPLLSIASSLSDSETLIAHLQGDD